MDKITRKQKIEMQNIIRNVMKEEGIHGLTVSVSKRGKVLFNKKDPNLNPVEAAFVDRRIIINGKKVYV